MSVSDVTNYLLFTNPVSRGVGSGIWGLGKMTGLVARDPVPTPRPLVLPPLDALVGGRFIWLRLGALSGASAIGMHVHYQRRRQNYEELLGKEYGQLDDELVQAEQQRMFETTSLFHFVHSIVLLCVPLMRRPVFTGSMLVFGIGLFAGSGYYRTLGGRRNMSALAGSGSCCLLIAWASMMV